MADEPYGLGLQSYVGTWFLTAPCGQVATKRLWCRVAGSSVGRGEGERAGVPTCKGLGIAGVVGSNEIRMGILDFRECRGAIRSRLAAKKEVQLE